MAGVGTNLIDTGTDLQYVVPAIVEARVMDQVQRQALWENIVGEENVMNLGLVGGTYDISQIPTVTMAATTQATEPDDQNFNMTKRTLTPATYGATFTVSWEGLNYSAIDVEAAIVRAVQAAYLTLYESSTSSGVSWAAMYAECSSLTSSPDHVQGVDGTALNEGSIRLARQLLLTQMAPMEVHNVVDPIQWSELMSDAACRQWLQNTRAAGIQAAVTRGVSPDRYLGDIHGVPHWVANALTESSGLHSIMFARGAIGVGYKMIATPLSPTPSRINIDIQWLPSRFAATINVRTIFDVAGLVFSANNNKWVVDTIS